MNLRDLIDEFRWEAADEAITPFWTDAFLARAASQAEQEACRRGALILDSSSPFCSISFGAGDNLLQLDGRILEIRRARLSVAGRRIYPITVAQLDRNNEQWESETGEPLAYVTDYQTGHIRLYPTPTAADEIQLTVRRLPLADLVDDNDEPEIRPESHLGLVQWMLYRAYMRQDADTFNPTKAAAALAEFVREFGEKKSMRNEEWIREGNSLDVAPLA
jgi:hypothetical protein